MNTDFELRKASLLADIRRERNGVVADATRYYGDKYALDYGVSLPVVRRIARRLTPEHDFARCLYGQEVRELRLLSLYIAEPEMVIPDEFSFWADGIINSEMAEEAAFALLKSIAALPALFEKWIVSSNSLLRYTALLAASRSDLLSMDWIVQAVDAVRRAAAVQTAGQPFAAHLTAQGAVALLSAVGAQNDLARQSVLRETATLGNSSSENYLRNELAWRL